MRYKTFLKNIFFTVSVFSILSLLLACPPAKDDDKKTPTVKLTLEKDAKKTSDKFVTKKENGGVKKDGKADTKIYYTVAAPDGTKFFTFTASSKSKGAISYTVQKVKADGTLDTIVNGAKDLVTVKATELAKGKVVFKNGAKGFYYLMAEQKAKGDYKKGSAKVLLLVDEVSIPTKAVVIDKLTFPSSGQADKTKVILDKKAKTVTVDTEDGKKFTVTAKIDYSVFPAEAPLPAAFQYSTTDALNANNVVATIDSSTGEIVQGDAANRQADIVIKVAIDKAAPYAALVAQDLYTIKKKS